MRREQAAVRDAYDRSQIALTRAVRVACVASLFACVGGCGGGGDSAPSNSMLTLAPTPAAPTSPPPAQPLPALPPSAPLVVGTAVSVDDGASGNPVSVRVARSANGDGFAVWQADDGTRRNLWASRYRSAAAAWSNPVNIESSNADIDDFDLTVDASGNAVVAWHEAPANPQLEQGTVMSARFDTGAGAWGMPLLLNSNSTQPRVASDGTGAVLAVHVTLSLRVHGRFFDPVSGSRKP